MRGALTVAGAAVVASDLWLSLNSWRQRSVLGGLLGAIGIPVVAFSVLADPTQRGHEAAILIGAIMFGIGVALNRLGRALQRLLDADDDQDR